MKLMKFPARYFTAKILSEGSVSIEYDDNSGIFYNSSQFLNREFSLYFIKAIIRKYNMANIRVLDAFTGTGIRSIQYLKEIP